MATHADRHDDSIDIGAVMHAQTGDRSVRVETDAPVYLFTPAQARRIAADLIQAADVLEAPFLVFTADGH